jgi:5-methylcytosine-specific restriction endonuclease McrA
MQTQVGEVDRISGSGNAIVLAHTTAESQEIPETKINEINIGPLPQTTVGKQVRFVYLEGPFGLCIEPKYLSQDYLAKVPWKREGKKILFENIANQINKQLFDSIVGQVDKQLIGELPLSDTVLAEPISSSSSILKTKKNKTLVRITPEDSQKWTYIGVMKGDIPSNVPHVPARVVTAKPEYVKVRPVVDKLENKIPDIGEIITVNTGPQQNEGTVAKYNKNKKYNVSVTLRDSYYPKNENIDAEVIRKREDRLIAKPAFSADAHNTVYLESYISPEKMQSKARIINKKKPVDIKPLPTRPESSTRKVAITGENHDALTGRWDIYNGNSIDLAEGDIVSVKIKSVKQNECIGDYNQYPIKVRFPTDIPSNIKGEEIRVSVETTHPDRAFAKPSWIEESQQGHDVRIIGISTDSAIGIKHGQLVRIPSPKVIETGDRLTVGVLPRCNGDIVDAAVSARPKFQSTEMSHYIQLPNTQGDTVYVDGNVVVVKDLPDINEDIILGVEEANTDHIVPSITALPKEQFPSEDKYLSIKTKTNFNNATIGVGEKLPVKIPVPISPNKRVTVRTTEARSDIILASNKDKNSSEVDKKVQETYTKLHLASSKSQKGRYKEAIEYLEDASMSCPSTSADLEELIITQQTLTRAIVSIYKRDKLDETSDIISKNLNIIKKFRRNHKKGSYISEVLRIRTLEMQATEQLLTALSKSAADDVSNLQAIAQGVSERDTVTDAIEFLNKAERSADSDLSDELMPSSVLQVVVQEFQDNFPGVVDGLQPFMAGKNEDNWFQFIFSEQMMDRAGLRLSGIKSISDVWQRPSVPQETGLISYKQNKVTQEESAIINSGGFISATEKLLGQDRISVLYLKDMTPKCSIDGRELEDDSKNTSETNTEPNTGEGEVANSKLSDDTRSGSVSLSRLKKLRERAEEESTENPERKHVETTTNRYQRSDAIRRYAIERSNGFCELCGESAPFTKENGEPFLEVHHINELGEGGADHPSLVGAICPNCHREIHHGKEGDSLNEKLQDRLEDGIGYLGSDYKTDGDRSRRGRSRG